MTPAPYNARPMKPLPGYVPKRKMPAAYHRWKADFADDGPVTLPETSYRPITDADLGMPTDDAAQAKAERYLRAAIGHWLHVEDKAREAARLAAAVRLMPGPTVHVEVPDHAVSLISPTDQLDATDKAILAEMQRIAAMGLPKWMRPEGEAAA